MNALASTATSARFFDRKPLIENVLDLFDYLPGSCLYVKDEQSRFARVNKELLEILDETDPATVLGRTDREFHPPALAEAYLAEDAQVIATGRPITNRVWLVLDAKGNPRWYVSSKVPLHEEGGDIIGIAGVMYPVATPAAQRSVFGELAEVVTYMEQNYRERISMKSLARQAGMSSTRFNQRFRALLRMTPTETLLAFRVEETRRLLVKTDWPLSRIAGDAGFYDQSHFTHRFRKATGMAPLAYRRRFRTGE